jgi:excisionase family DNA binding protein
MSRPSEPAPQCSTLEAARLLGMAVRSVQLMVDRGELEAWKTPGGHRRISRASLDAWLGARQGGAAAPARSAATAAASVAGGNGRVLVIEDSRHYQTLVSLLLREHFPNLTVKLADEGVSGLALAGQWQPQVLIVDILLPGIDGATLIMSLRSHPQFAASRLIVITSLDGGDLAPYRFALEGVTVVHKSRLVTELPLRLGEALGQAPAHGQPAA